MLIFFTSEWVRRLIVKIRGISLVQIICLSFVIASKNSPKKRRETRQVRSNEWEQMHLWLKKAMERTLNCQHHTFYSLVQLLNWLQDFSACKTGNSGGTEIERQKLQTRVWFLAVTKVFQAQVLQHSPKILCFSINSLSCTTVKSTQLLFPYLILKLLHMEQFDTIRFAWQHLSQMKFC